MVSLMLVIWRSGMISLPCGFQEQVGSFYDPDKTRMISRMTITSGPAKFMKLAKRLVRCCQDQAFSPSFGLVYIPVAVYPATVPCLNEKLSNKSCSWPFLRLATSLRAGLSRLSLCGSPVD